MHSFTIESVEKKYKATIEIININTVDKKDWIKLPDKLEQKLLNGISILVVILVFFGMLDDLMKIMEIELKTLEKLIHKITLWTKYHGTDSTK